MKQNIISYILTLIIFLVIDAVWLGFVATDFYFSQLGDLMTDNVRYGVALAFYCLYCVGVMIFAVKPALDKKEWKHAALYGALFGLFCYATYDLTNVATIRDWPVMMSMVDIVWGTWLTGTTATLGYFASRKVLG